MGVNQVVVEMIVLPIANNDSSDNTRDRARLRHLVTPKGQNKGESGDLEGDQKSFIETKYGQVSLGMVFWRDRCEMA